jgi:uncharacterized protein (TIGR02145 family)
MKPKLQNFKLIKFMKKFFTFLFAALMSVSMFATTVVTITQDDFPSEGQSFTKDGVTVSAVEIDGSWGDLLGGGSFSTTLGNFTQIEVTATDVYTLGGEGWSGNAQKMTWTGNASSVSFSGDIMGYGMGTTLKFTIEPASTPEPEPEPEPASDGKLSGGFTINASGDQISFSKGNLQATTTDNGANWTWEFAANQWDYVGNAAANNAINGNKTVSANGSVDLFGWSTAATYYGINNSDNPATYSGAFVDWGATIGAGWRTLSTDEWAYLFNTRTNASSKYGMATVANMHGVIILPDVYEGTAINANHSAWNNNIISAVDWEAYEAAGAVFLPTPGYRDVTTTGDDGSSGYYWASTASGNNGAFYLVISSNDVSATSSNRNYGQSVRLVTAYVAPTPEPEPEPAAKYYIVGNMNSWQVDENYEMNPNIYAETEEYFYALDLTTTSEFKVVKVEGENQTWYPTGMGNNYGQNGEITEDAEYTIYFRPNYDGGENWFYNCIYVSKNEPEPTGVENVQTNQVPSNQVQSTKVIRNGILFIERDGKLYNAQGAEIK